MGSEPTLITALELFNKRQRAQRITTACKNMNKLLGGGVETHPITEFIGEYGTVRARSVCNSV